jgi:hypothetical protein
MHNKNGSESRRTHHSSSSKLQCLVLEPARTEHIHALNVLRTHAWHATLTCCRGRLSCACYAPAGSGLCFSMRTCVQMCAQIGKVLKLVSKDSPRHLHCLPAGYVNGMLRMCDGNWPQPLHLRTCTSNRQSAYQRLQLACESCKPCSSCCCVRGCSAGMATALQVGSMLRIESSSVTTGF